MKLSKSDIHCKAHKILIPKFEDQKLTSFAGLVVFQALFKKLDLTKKLRNCFSHQLNRQYGFAPVILVLIIHLLLGFRRLRDIDYYVDDPIVKRVAGMDILPSVSSISRHLSSVDDKGLINLQQMNIQIVTDRLKRVDPSRITLDFDGTVQSATARAEGSAVGFHKKKKGARSYYPLLCTVAQTGQVLDVCHRPGNVHDSKEADSFIRACFLGVKACSPRTIIESRTDSAFFSDQILNEQESLGIEYTTSVPFSRFSELKSMVEKRTKWHTLDDDESYFECAWKAKSWSVKRRIIFIKQRVRQVSKEPVQLDLFEPYDYGFEFKAIVTNKNTHAKSILKFHNGRGSQEGIFSELKTHCNQDYVPTKTLIGNKTFLMAGVLAHNLSRELHMNSFSPERKTTKGRQALWVFRKLETLRRNVIQRAGRITNPQGELTLTMNANEAVQKEILNYLDRTA